MLRQALRYYDWKAKVGGHRIALKGQEYAAVARLPLLAPLAFGLSGPLAFWPLVPLPLWPSAPLPQSMLFIGVLTVRCTSKWA